MPLAMLRFAVCLVLALHAVQDRGQSPVAGLVKVMRAQPASVAPDHVRTLAAFRTREAMEALVVIYDVLPTLAQRREVLRALATFDDVDPAARPALQKICDVATLAPQRELREAAIASLGDCPKLGKHFLALIVDSPSDAWTREQAMAEHVAHAAPDDYDFYVKVFRAGDAKKEKVVPSPGREPPRRVPPLPRLRELALREIAPKLKDDELVRAATYRGNDGEEKLPRDGVRRIALAELARRDDSRALEIARRTWLDTTETAANRAAAAEIVAHAQGAGVAFEFIEEASKHYSVVPGELRDALADLLAAMNDPGVDERLERLLAGKAGADGRIFALHALSKAGATRLAHAVERLLADPDPQVQIAAAGLLAVHGDAGALDELERLLSAGASFEVRDAAFDALGALRADDPEWQKRLAAGTVSRDVSIRNAALEQLAKQGRKANLPYFARALLDDEWSTRLAALKGLQHIGTPEAIDAIVARMSAEEGRMRREFCDTLWHLTGQPFLPDPQTWQTWWRGARTSFKGVGTGDLLRMQREEETRALSQATTTSFYGVRVVSHRVIFILDISNSMNEPTRSPYVGRVGDARIEVAKRELARCLDELEPGSLFNIVVFSDGVARWLDEGISLSRKHERSEAQAYVRTLSASGGTNLYGALQAAFADADADTIYVLSDGEPSVGEVIDTAEIRERVRQWNEHRGVVVHSIAVGGRLELLEKLAADSGGTHVRFD